MDATRSIGYRRTDLDETNSRRPPPPASRAATSPPQQAILLLQQQMNRGQSVLQKNPVPSVDYRNWHNTTRDYLVKAFGEPSANVETFLGASAGGIFWEESAAAQDRRDSLQQQTALLASMIQILTTEAGLPPARNTSPSAVALTAVERICEGFHLVARQLRSRHENRPTLDVDDEYDVQDLLHALLRVDFDDIRPEEYTPSYAGKASRMDFLLKKERIVVEAKKTRRGLADKEIGSQLIEDIGRYRVHPDCRTLVCFVYDPEGRISNPAGLESDLSRSDGDLDVRVLIFPKGR